MLPATTQVEIAELSSATGWQLAALQQDWLAELAQAQLDVHLQGVSRMHIVE